MESQVISVGVALIIFLLVFLLVGVKLILKPGSVLHKSCGGLKDEGCHVCGLPAGQFCADPEKESCASGRMPCNSEQSDNPEVPQTGKPK